MDKHTKAIDRNRLLFKRGVSVKQVEEAVERIYEKEKTNIENPWISSIQRKINSTYHPYRDTPLSDVFPLLSKLINFIISKDMAKNDKDIHTQDQQEQINRLAKHNFKTILKEAAKYKYKNARHQSLFCIKDIGNDKKGEEFKDDPFLNFGSGIVAYRGLLKNLIILFFAISMLMIPVVYIYQDNPDMIKHQSWLS